MARLGLPFVVTVGLIAAGGCSDDAVETGPPGACPSGRDFSSCDPGDACSRDVSCQSGNVTLLFSCDADGAWQLAPKDCEQPYDFCPGTLYQCVETWFEAAPPINPPAPCPSSAPAAGEMCLDSVMGGHVEKCGYRCPDSAAWTVATCTEATGGVWKYDAACAP
jgi:hypothetical protein